MPGTGHFYFALTRLRPPRQACVIVRRGGNDRDAVRPPSIPSGHVTPDLQSPFDVGIVMATLVRDTFDQAVRSVFAQRFEGRIQILVGIDRWQGDRAVFEQLRNAAPSHVATG